MSTTQAPAPRAYAGRKGCSSLILDTRNHEPFHLEDERRIAIRHPITDLSSPREIEYVVCVGVQYSRISGVAGQIVLTETAIGARAKMMNDTRSCDLRLRVLRRTARQGYGGMILLIQRL
jgi:hypothetical protein